jgi:hypothetical protein
MRGEESGKKRHQSVPAVSGDDVAEANRPAFGYEQLLGTKLGPVSAYFIAAECIEILDPV